MSEISHHTLVYILECLIGTKQNNIHMVEDHAIRKNEDAKRVIRNHNQRRTGNTMANRKATRRQTMVYKTLPIAT